jgi:hypothetical protein
MGLNFCFDLVFGRIAQHLSLPMPRDFIPRIFRN